MSADKTVRLLRRMASRVGRPADVTDFGECKLEKPRDLAVLEREGLLPTSTPTPSDGYSVRLFYASNPFEECEHAAAYIRRTVQQTRARWRDFAVISRDGDRYTAALQMAMARYDVAHLPERQGRPAHPPAAAAGDRRARGRDRRLAV